MAVLVADGLMYNYGNHQVLDGVSLALEAGTAVALIGVNGAGKSTLLRCLAGWAMPQKGDVTIHELSLRKQEQAFRREVIFVPDTPDFYDSLTAWDHLQFVAQLHHVEDWEETAEDLLDDFHLLSQADAYPFSFSRGMRYKLALSMALLIKPPLLLLDEPFGPLDAVSSDLLWQQLQAVRDAGRTVLFSTHALLDTQLPDQYLLMRDGKLTQIDQPDTTKIGALLTHVE